MKRVLAILIIYFAGSYLAFGQHCYGENLIPNPSLDSFSICPDNYWQIDRAVPWTQPLWHSASSVINQCMFDGNPTQMDTVGGRKLHWRSLGMTYNILWDETNWRVYVETQLKHQLVAGQCYYGEFFVLTEFATYKVIDAIGIYFSDTLIKIKYDTIIGGDTIGFIKPIYANPQITNPQGNILKDTAHWEKVSGTFVAQGTETAMIVGNFKYNSEIQWEILNNSPMQSSRYFFDDFVLCKCEDTIPPDTIKPIEPKLEVYPNPANENLFILYDGYDQAQAVDLEIFNVLGELVMNKQIISNSEPSSVSTDQLSPGCYILLLRTASKNLYKDRLIIIR